MFRALRPQLLIALVAGIVIFTNLGTPRLWDDDEPRNAQCAYEMYEAGNWVVPTFNGGLRTDKPILLYWFMLLAYHVFGPSEFSARLPSALCGIGTALLTFHLGRRLFNDRVGLWAGLLVSSSLWFVVASRAATPDGLLIFFSTLSLWLYVRGAFPLEADSSLAQSGAYRGIPQSGWTFVFVYAAMAMAVLAKGPIGVLLPGSVIGCFVLCMNTRRRETDVDGPRLGLWGSLRAVGSWLVRTFGPRRIAETAWQLRPFSAMLIVAAIAAPWYIVVGLQTDGEWPAGFFLKHNISRFSTPMEGHGGPPLYHLFSIAVCFFPASIFLAPMIHNTVRQLRAKTAIQPGLIFAVGWVVVYVAFFSIAGTKLPSYVTPTYPPLAVLTGFFFYQWATAPQEISRLWQRIALVVFGLVGCVMLFALPQITAKFAPGEEWLASIGLIPLLGAIAAIVLSERGRVRTAMATFVVFAAAFTTAMFGWAVLRIDRFQNAELMATTVRENATGEPEVASYGFFRSSWVFYTHQVIHSVDDAQQAGAYLESSPDAFLVTVADRLEEIEPQLPDDVEILLRRPRFLKNGELILLGRRSSASAVLPAAKPTESNRF